MTGRDHYAEAEGCLMSADCVSGHESVMEWIAQAQVHATLALAAAMSDGMAEPLGEKS